MLVKFVIFGNTVGKSASGKPYQRESVAAYCSTDVVGIQRPRAPVPLESPQLVEDARTLAERCTTLAELEAAIRAFEGCALKRTAKNTVFADGSLRFIPDRINVSVFQALGTRAGGEAVPSDY